MYRYIIRNLFVKYEYKSIHNIWPKKDNIFFETTALIWNVFNIFLIILWPGILCDDQKLPDTLSSHLYVKPNILLSFKFSTVVRSDFSFAFVFWDSNIFPLIQSVVGGPVSFLSPVTAPMVSPFRVNPLQ